MRVTPEIRQVIEKLRGYQEQGILDAVLKADASNVLRKVWSAYQESRGPVNRNEQASRDMNKNLTERTLPVVVNEMAKAVSHSMRPVRRLSYFERQTARQLGKSVDRFGNVDLNENSNCTSGQSLNPNAHIASGGVEQMFGKTLTDEDMRKAELIKARSYCAKFCKQQGNTRCRYCHGVGFSQMNAPSRSVNKAREIQPKNRAYSTKV